jgi:hypothetical protein
MSDGHNYEPIVRLLSNIPNSVARVVAIVNRIRAEQQAEAFVPANVMNARVAKLDQIIQIFSYLERQGELNETLQRMRAHFADNAALASAIDQALPSKRIPSWYTDRVVMDKAFINRDGLRTKLYELVERHAHNRSLLLVSSDDDGPGKSHTWWLLKHVADTLGIDAVQIDLREYTSMHLLAQSIADNLAFDESFKSRFTTDLKEAESFQNWFAGQLRTARSGRRCLLVFDHLGRDNVPSDVRQLVQSLMRGASGARFSGVQIVVLDCPQFGFQRVAGRCDEERIELLTKPTIDAFVAWMCDLKVKAGSVNTDPPADLTATLTALQFPITKTALETLETQLTNWWLMP